MKLLTFALFSLIFMGCATQSPIAVLNDMTTSSSPEFQNGRADVNGLQMYYEIHGSAEGVPLVLLPGGGSTIEATYGQILPILSLQRQVIAVEEQGHGRTTQRAGPIRFETSADDVAALLKHLKISKADIFGFSNGANVALQMALRHPQMVNKMIFASSVTKREGAPAEFWKFINKATFSDMPQSLKDAFLKVNPDFEQLKVMHDKDLERMKNFKDVSDKEVQSIKVPTLILLGDRDSVKPSHGAELARLMPAARLLIVPGGHGDYLGELTAKSPSAMPGLTAGLVQEFLNAR